MTDQSDLVEELLFAEEDTSLDFKREQYPFDRADKETKSELLKDILAFVNAFRRTDAYILIGVEENRGGRSKVVGIQEHLDDAKLQQFVNSKTQLPVTFSYRELVHDGLPIGLIHIPSQTRPIYAKANYGKVAVEAVYIRRGSSTGIAKPEEIIRMGAAPVAVTHQPTAELHLIERSTGEPLGDRVNVEGPTWLNVPPRGEIPKYNPGESVGTGSVQIVSLDPFANSAFYRELAEYLQTERCFEASLELENTGESVIHDASIAIELADPNRVYELLGSRDRPIMPARRNTATAWVNRIPSGIMSGDVFVRREGGSWKVDCQFGKVRPGERVRLEEDLLIGCRSAGEVQINGRVFGDNIGRPILVGFVLHFSSGSLTLSVEEIKAAAHKFGDST